MRLGFKFGRLANHIGLSGMISYEQGVTSVEEVEELIDRLEWEDPVLHFKLMLVLEKMDRTHAGEDYNELNFEYNRLLRQFAHGWIAYRLLPRDPVCANEVVWAHPGKGDRDGYWTTL